MRSLNGLGTMLSHEFANPVKPSRVVVLGATGFVARRLVAWLGHRGIACRPTGSAEVDLVQPSAAASLNRIIEPKDAIVITSALTPERGRDRATFLKNVAMVDHVCSLVTAAPCSQVVYISSDSVYASHDGILDEECFCESSDLYALSHIVREKLLAETCAAAYIPLTILRPSAIYGATDTHNSYGPNRFLRSALREGKITLFGQGEENRDHVYIDDVVELIELCLRHRSAGILNAASGTPLSFLDVARVICAAVGRAVVIETAARHVPIVNRRFRTSGLRSAFPDFKPTPIEAGVRRAIDELMHLEQQEKRRTGCGINTSRLR
jgi:UDP-glucose 4-epimerase